MNRLILTTLTLCWIGMLSVHAADAEAQMRTDFQKAFQTTDEKTRASIYSTLNGAKEKATLDMLLRVARMEKLPENRLAAFKALTSFEDTDTSVAMAASNLFTQEQDESNKAQFAENMTNMRFKFMPLQALVGYYSTSSFMPPALGDASPKQVAFIEKHQTNMEKVHQSIVKLSGNSVVFDKSARTLVKKWWEQNQSTVMKADQDLVKEMKAAAKAAK